MVDSHQQLVANGNSTGVDAQAKQFLNGVAKEYTNQGITLDGRGLFSASTADFYNHDKYMNLYNSQELVQFAYNNLGAMNLGSTPNPAAITQYMKYESDSNKRAATAAGLLVGAGAVTVSVKAASILAQMGVTAWRTCMSNPVLCANEAAIAAGEVVGAEALPLGLGGAAGAAAVAKKLEQEIAQAATQSTASAANALRLRTQLAFQEADILTKDGKLTAEAILESKPIPLTDAVIRNPRIVKELTSDGSNIKDWGKYTTETIPAPNGQRLQIHYYKNSVTGKVDYSTVDYKVKGTVMP
jgi:filamentous hemagglutinin